ncbi:aldo/keto reductase [Artomyces pyxidatus]|uniref:Aldo/keto reductase n=1 Tax=Artomyces pyxidatus TaxID=48021 RepID=A0ACB8SHK6_9AGAM|nr:aldo/keto reductase [Artomyces pyxidatus]
MLTRLLAGVVFLVASLAIIRLPDIHIPIRTQPKPHPPASRALSGAMISKTANLGGTASNTTVAKIGHGLMMMTWRDPQIPDEQAFASLKAGMDSLPPGTKMFLNSGEFYGLDPPTANLELLARFFERYPEYTDKAFLSVKCGMSFNPYTGLEAALERKIDFVLSKLRGKKKLDLFEPARPIHGIPIEESTRIMAKFIAKGKFDHIGMSEVRADTVRRAHSAHPIAAVEIEVSPWSYTQETKDVLATCEELGIAVIAYSPLGHGFLTGKWKSYNDLEKDNMLRQFSRFQKDNFTHNLALVAALEKIAANKGVSTAQLCIAWVASLGPKVVPIPGSSNNKRTLENVVSGDIILTGQELADIKEAMAVNTVKGTRY